MKKYFCSSDIHSYFSAWMDSLKHAEFNIHDPNHIVIVCGDLLDRGDESSECLNFVQELLKQNRLIYIRGNHEDLLIDCFTDIKHGNVGQHHLSNGTVKTISHLMNCSKYDLLCGCYDRNKFTEVSTNIINFINKETKNYFELGDKVFVHGWIPAYQHVDNYQTASDNDWEHARWENCFDMWARTSCRPEGKTVVCGHWHTSYGWSKFRGEPEWGLNAKFKPFIDSQIIALDACTAYTNMINVVTFDEKGNLIR